MISFANLAFAVVDRQLGPDPYQQREPTKWAQQKHRSVHDLLSPPVAPASLHRTPSLLQPNSNLYPAFRMRNPRNSLGIKEYKYKEQ